MKIESKVTDLKIQNFSILKDEVKNVQMHRSSSLNNRLLSKHIQELVKRLHQGQPSNTSLSPIRTQRPTIIKNQPNSMSLQATQS